MDPKEFWRTTPREIQNIFDGIAERDVREHNERVVLAYMTANFHRADPKKLRKVDSYLVRVPRRTARPKQTAEQMFEMARMITLAMGGKVIPKEKMN